MIEYLPAQVGFWIAAFHSLIWDFRFESHFWTYSFPLFKNDRIGIDHLWLRSLLLPAPWTNWRPKIYRYLMHFFLFHCSGSSLLPHIFYLQLLACLIILLDTENTSLWVLLSPLISNILESRDWTVSFLLCLRIMSNCFSV